MAQDMFSKWDKEIDTEGLQKDVEEAAANGGQGNYKEVPHGNYELYNAFPLLRMAIMNYEL